MSFRFEYFCAGLLLCLLMSLARAEILPVKNYTSADGLIYEEGLRIYQDSHGFVWMTTPVGVSRFDGYQFKNYGIEDGLYNTLMTDMVEDDNGIYWFGTMGGIIYRFDPRVAVGAENPAGESAGAKKFADFKVSANEPYINRILKTSGGTIYIATANGLFTLDDSREGAEKFLPTEIGAGKNELNFTSLAEDQAGSVWIGYQKGLIRRLPNGAMIHYEIEPNEAGSDLVRSLAVDAGNRIWLITENRHLVVFNPEPVGSLNASDKRTRRPRFDASNQTAANLAQGYAYRFPTEATLGDGSFRAITATRDGRIWLAAFKVGLVNFDGREFRLYTKANGLSNDSLTALMEDSFGNLWIGSNGGAMKLSRKGFVTYNLGNGLSDERIMKIFEDRRNGTIYATNPNWTINRFDGRKFDAVKLNIPAAQTNWLSHKILLDNQGDWWFASQSGLYRYSGIEKLEQINASKPAAVYTTANGLPSDNIFGLFEDSNRNIWISDAERGDALTLWTRESNEFRRFDQADGIPEKCFARHFREDAAGNIYFGCSERHLVVYQQGRFTSFESQYLPPGWWIADNFVDRRGILWAAAPVKGLVRIENLASGNPTERLYTTADGLSSIHVQFIAEDNDGRIHFVTTRGMDVLEPETGRVKHYSLADGLAGAGTGYAIRHSRTGEIWLALQRGISRFMPEPDKPSQPPPVFIGSLRVAGREVAISALGETTISGIVLEPDQRDAQIDFYGLNLTSGDVLRYQYRLEGADAEWSQPSVQRSVSLSLSSGNYKFEVRAVTLDGTPSAAPATVSFTVLRPVWQRWWFLMLAALFVSFLIYSIYRYRVAQLLKLERVRTRIATDLHDDIGSSLSQIAILSEVVRQKVGGDNGAGEPLSMIAETSREMVDSMSDIVWAINPDKDHFSDLIQRMRRFASDVLDARDIRYRFHFDERHRDAALGADIRREVYLIFKEAVNNLVKYADASRVEMSVLIENNRLLVVRVADDGKGFRVAAQSDLVARNYDGYGGNGLINMRRRAETLGGRFSIESSSGAGTTVEIKIPL